MESNKINFHSIEFPMDLSNERDYELYHMILTDPIPGGCIALGQGYEKDGKTYEVGRFTVSLNLDDPIMAVVSKSLIEEDYEVMVDILKGSLLDMYKFMEKILTEM